MILTVYSKGKRPRAWCRECSAWHSEQDCPREIELKYRESPQFARDVAKIQKILAR